MYQLNPFLREFWRTKARNKVLYGGRASSKSHDAAGMAVFLAANFTLKFLCVRQFQNKISESVYTLLKSKIENSEFKDEFVLTKNSIKHKTTGSEFIFYGIARNLEEIKSTEGIDILWIEEAHALTEDQWQTLNATIRADGSEVWIIFNPDEYTDYVYQNFILNPPKNTITKEINYNNNPFLSQTMLEVIQDEYERDPLLAKHIYGGQPKMGQDRAVINMLYILAAIDAHKKITVIDKDKPAHLQRKWEKIGKRTIGFDVADDGDDLCATIESHGNIVTGADQWFGLEDQLLKSTIRVYNRALELGASVTFDSIGVGAQVGPKFAELNDARNFDVEYDAFNAGSGVENPDGVYMRLPHLNILNKDHFSNIKAQKWDEVATRFRKTYEVIELGASHPIDELISIDSESFKDKKLLDKLKLELASPKKDVDGNGRFKVESKKDMLKRGIKSPNLADAFIMSQVKPKRAAVGFFDVPRRPRASLPSSAPTDGQAKAQPSAPARRPRARVQRQ
jgi:phage terminase large subunit